MPPMSSTPPTNTAAAAPAGAPAAPAAPARGLQGLPDGIEIFSAGTHTDDQGRRHTFTRAMLEEMAATYNRSLREAPLTVGHPRDNLPAYGWVQRVFINEAGNLAIDPHQVDEAFAEMVRAGRFKKRSASFYPPGAAHNPTPGKWYLRHVAFLGAQPPAVAGLKDIGFAAGDFAEALCFGQELPDTDLQPTSKELPMSEADKAELERLRAENQQLAAGKQAAEQAAEQARADAQKAQSEVKSYAEQAAAERQAGFVAFAEAQIKAGRLLPRDKAVCVAALQTLAQTPADVSFSEGSQTTQITALQMCAWLQGQMSSRNAIVDFAERAAGNAPGFDARGKSDDEVHRAAQDWLDQHPEANYAQALGHVTRFTQ